MLGAVGHHRVLELAAGVLEQRPRRRPWQSALLGRACSQQHDALGQLAGSRSVLAGRDLAAPARRARCRTRRSRPRSCTPSGRTVDAELARPADAAELGVDAPHLAPRCQAVSCRARGSGPRRAAGHARRGTRRPPPARVADAALDRVAAVIDRRRRVLDHDPLRRRSGQIARRSGGWALGGVRAHAYRKVSACAHRVNTASRERDHSRPAASSCTSPRCRAARSGPEAYRFVDWLAAAGQSWWQVLPLGPPDRYRSPYKSSSAFAAWRGLLADPRAPVSSAELLDFRERQRFWIGDWERFSQAAARLADQVRFEREWAALRAYAAAARRADDGRRGRSTSRPAAPTTGPTRELFHDGWHGRRAARRVQRPRASCGATRCTTGRRCSARGYRWWVERLRRTLELFDLARIDHFRGFVAYWAVPRGRPDGDRRALAPRARAPPCSGALRRSLGELPLVAEDLGVITAAGAPPARPARAARDAGASSSGWTRAGPTARTGPTTTWPTGSSTPAPTTRTPPAAGWSRCPLASGGSWTTSSSAAASPSASRGGA